MKNLFVLPIFTVIFLSSCGTYAGSGAMTGGSLGSVLGSAIGGIAGGGRGSNIGTIVGMAGGAMVGATIGAKADKHNKSSIVDNVYDSQDNSHIDTCVSIQDRGVAPSDTVEHNVFWTIEVLLMLKSLMLIFLITIMMVFYPVMRKVSSFLILRIMAL